MEKRYYSRKNNNRKDFREIWKDEEIEKDMNKITNTYIYSYML